MWFTANSKVGFIGTDRGASLIATVSGVGKANSGLKCTAANTTSWSYGEVAYQWRRNGALLARATNQTYTVQSRDVGAKVSCRVSVVFKPAYSEQAVFSSPILIC